MCELSRIQCWTEENIVPNFQLYMSCRHDNAEILKMQSYVLQLFLMLQDICAPEYVAMELISVFLYFLIDTYYEFGRMCP